ncbi:MAG: SgcJ/EcaC family oxidoreductase [Alphaproteobacteria bacterium]
MLRLAAATMWLVFMAGAAVAQDKPTIQKLNDQWVAAFNKGDSHAVAELYADDAYVLPAGGEMVHGRQAIQGLWDTTMKQLGDAKLTAIDVQPLGPDAAREIGTFNFKTKSNTPQDVSGKYVVVWRKINNQWKLATDIWNMNK